MGQYPLQPVDFESWDQTLAATAADHLDEWDNACWTGSVGSMNTGHTGVGRCIVNPSNFTRRVFKGPSLDPSYDAWYWRLWMRFDANTGTQNAVQMLGGTPGSPVTHLEFRFLSGNLSVVANSVTFTATGSGAGLAANTWYDVELCVLIRSDATGSFEARVNGVADAGLTRSGVRTSSQSSGTPNMLRITNAAARFDDLTVKAGFESWQASDFMSRTDGYPIVVTLYPNDEGNYSEWTKSSGSAATYTYVDESQANTSDYLSANANALRTSFKMENTPSDARTFHAIKTVSYARGGNSNERMLHWVRLANQLDIRHRATAWLMDTPWVFRDRIWKTNLRTGKAWAKSNIDGMECMYQRSTGAATAIDLSQVTCEVLYEPLVPSAGKWSGDNLPKRRTHRHATCWKITRTDGQELTFTNTDKPLVIDGDTYRPTGGMDATAERREGELRDRNKDFLGLITSDLITDDDLRAGRYRNAECVEFVVDWRFPWGGDIDRTRYWVGHTEWTEALWEAQVNGLTRWLKPRVGGAFFRTCDREFGAPKCFYHIDGTMHPGVSVASVTSRSVFTASTSDIPLSVPDDFFTDGKLIFRDGNNWGIIRQVKQYTAATREFKLATPLPFTITTAHHFDAWEGCARTEEACIAKNNLVNHGGNKYMPGTDKLFQTVDT